MVAREIEKIGIPTVTFNLISEIVSIVGIPRAVSVKNPFGRTIGRVNNMELQLDILKQALEFANYAKTPGEMKTI